MVPMDSLTPKQRSARMALIRSKNTRPERAVRASLHRLGYRFRLHRKDLPGVPDIVFPSRKVVVFVHGCFWHAHGGKCTGSNMPKSRKAYWRGKFEANKARDKKNKQLLRKAGWNVVTVWECETRRQTSMLAKLAKRLGPPRLGLQEGNGHGS